jgi:hypothetical protein
MIGNDSRQDRLFRALLRVFPLEFRGDFGRQMTEDFRDQREDAATRLTRSGSFESGRPPPRRSF